MAKRLLIRSVASYVVWIDCRVSDYFAVYPVTTFSLGNASVTFYAVPVGTVLFALFGWLGLRNLHFSSFLSWLYGHLSGDRSDVGMVGTCPKSRRFSWRWEYCRGILRAKMTASSNCFSKEPRYLIGGYCGQAGQWRNHPDFADGRIIDPILHALAL